MGEGGGVGKVVQGQQRLAIKLESEPISDSIVNTFVDSTTSRQSEDVSPKESESNSNSYTSSLIGSAESFIQFFFHLNHFLLSSL